MVRVHRNKADKRPSTTFDSVRRLCVNGFIYHNLFHTFLCEITVSDVKRSQEVGKKTVLLQCVRNEKLIIM